ACTSSGRPLGSAPMCGRRWRPRGLRRRGRRAADARAVSGRCAFERSPGVIRGADERAGLDAKEPEAFPLPADPLELFGRVVALDWQPPGVGLQVLADGRDVAARVLQI